MTGSNISNFIDLSHVNELIAKALSSKSPLLNEVVSYTAAGKQIRPTLALLTYCAVKNGTNGQIADSVIDNQEFSNDIYKTAAALELLHMATLLHDDIIDEAPLRRRKPSTFARYGLNASLLAGDFLYIRAFGLCATLNKSLILEVEKTCISLTEGEIQETPLNIKGSTVEEALEIASKKTASLFRLACLVGADIALREKNIINAPLVEKIASFGEKLGIAFQIIDDILDIVSSEEELGKPVGGDIKERKPSLVNVLWLNSQSEIAQKLLRSDLKIEDYELNSAIEEIKKSNIITEAKQIAANYLSDAELILKELTKDIGESKSTKLLQEILQYSKDRKF